MKEKIKKMNRTLFELECGIFAMGVVLQVTGVWFAKEKVAYSIGVWIGILVAAIVAVHMWRSLNKALDVDEGSAGKMMVASNLVRYGIILIAIVILFYVNIANPIATFLGIMMLKVAAYLQPLTHKLCNKFFNETDPIGQPLQEESQEKQE